jgi:hypothetical protein
MADEDAPARRGYRIKVMHLIYAIISITAIIIVAIVYVAFFSAPVNTASLGNGWKGVMGAQPFLVGNNLYVTFIGIEGCQFCAAERYALFDALGNFGNWTYYGNLVNLSTLPTSNLTVNPQPYSLFYKASEGDWTINFLSPHLKYSSDYVDFTAAETLDNSGSPLQSLDAIQSGYISKYDSGGAVPFTVIGGNFYEIGAGDSLISNGAPIIFRYNGTGFLPSYIIANFNITGSAMDNAIKTEADYISAIICFDIANAAPVCSNPEIAAISSKL